MKRLIKSIVVLALFLGLLFGIGHKLNQKDYHINATEAHQEPEERQEEEGLYDAFIATSLVPRYGFAKKEMNTANIVFSQNKVCLKDYEFSEGIVSLKETDMDGDQIPELIMVNIEKNEEYSSTTGYDTFLCIHIYHTDENNEIQELEQPDRELRYGILRAMDAGVFHVFLSEQDGVGTVGVWSSIKSSDFNTSSTMYMDAIGVSKETIVCRKSYNVTEKGLLDTTAVSQTDVDEGNVTMEELPVVMEVPEEEKWEKQLEYMKENMSVYVTMEGPFAGGYDKEWETWMMNENLFALPYMHDYNMGEFEQNVQEIFRLRTIPYPENLYGIPDYSMGRGTQTWEFFDFTRNVKDAAYARYGAQEAYEKVVRKYKDGIEKNSFTRQPIEKCISDLNGPVIRGVIDGSFQNLAYAYSDIDGNGVDELILGYKIKDEYHIFDVYSYDGYQARKLFNENGLGIAVKLDLYQSGEILKTYTYNTSEYKVYQISEEGYFPKLTGCMEQRPELGEKVELQWNEW